MDTRDIRQKSNEELQKTLGEQREALRAARFDASERQLKNVRTIREIKRTVARIETELVARTSRVSPSV